MIIKEWVSQNFYFIQITIGVFFIAMLLLTRLKNESKSQFKIREADLKSKNRTTQSKQDLANAKIKNKNPVYLLTGIRIDGKPHEVLGISAQAHEDEIQKAYRELIKRYHPDKVGKPESQEWYDAQKLADALTKARNEMLQKIKNK